MRISDWSSDVCSSDLNALAARVAELEQRLSRITLQAESASGNASRAEGLLVAFAVRRALDRGLSLGYLDAQLRLRFGDDQPNAVKTIIDTSREPVKIGRANVWTPVTNAQLVCSILLAKKKYKSTNI